MAENPPQVYMPYHLKDTLRRQNYLEGQCRVQFSPDGLLLAVATTPDPCTYIICTPRPILHKVFRGHTAHVTDLAFSSDSRFLATTSYDTNVRLWNVYKGVFVRTLTGHNDVVSCVKFGRKYSNMIASGSFDATIRIWNAVSGACQNVIYPNSGAITGVDFCPHGSTIVACSIRGLCGIWDTDTGHMRVTIKNTGNPMVGSVKFSSDGMFVLMGTMNRTLTIWSMVEALLYTLNVRQYNMSGLVTFLGADDRYLVSGSDDYCLWIREVRYGRVVQIIAAHNSPALSVSCHPTRNLIATACPADTNTVKLWTQDSYS